MDESFESLCTKRNTRSSSDEARRWRFSASQGCGNNSALPVQALSRTPHSTVVDALNPFGIRLAMRAIFNNLSEKSPCRLDARRLAGTWPDVCPTIDTPKIF